MAEDATSLENTAEALVTMKGGKGNSFQPISPRRGHPVRIRKPNPRIYGDDEEDFRYFTPRPRKQPKPQLVVPAHLINEKNVLSTPDKKTAQCIGMRLRNLLKLPKAHKWVCYEWFYSNIDEPLFLGENDFCICLKQSFPQLKTRKLSRIQWSKIRRLMGKPRRCSSAFFAEERSGLLEKREKIRMLQQRKSSEITDFKDLPDEVPMPLVIGTKVTARLRKPQDGLFTGVIDALDTINNTYRITFDRSNLGTHSVPDIEVLDNDPLLGSSPLRGSGCVQMEDGTLGGFPVKFLILVTKLTKIMAKKKDKIKELKDLNTLAEITKSYGKPFELPFQHKYASLVLELENLNHDLNEYLLGVQGYCHDLAPEQGAPQQEMPSEVKKKNEEEAHDLVITTNIASGKKMVRSERMLSLVTKLTALLLQIRTFSENDMQSFEFQSLQESLTEIKGSLDPSNVGVFENHVEVHVNHVQSGLTQLGNLHAFAAANSMAAL